MVETVWGRQSLTRKISFYAVGTAGAAVYVVLGLAVGQRAMPHDLGMVIAYGIAEVCFLILWPMATLRWKNS